jgi:DNA-binding ferritin-like protein
MNPVHTTIAAVALLAAAGSAKPRGSRSVVASTMTRLATLYAPVLIDYGIKVVSKMTRSQIKKYLSLNRAEQAKMLRKRLRFSFAAMPHVAIPLNVYMSKPKRAESLAAFVDDFLREHGEKSVQLATKIAKQQAAKKVKGSANHNGLHKLQHLLALLRTLRWHYHTTHWRVQGKNFYGDHLMFERLYKGDPSLDDEIDTLGEKMVSLYGRDVVTSQTIWPEATRSLEAVASQSCPYRQALMLEQEVQQTLKSAHDSLKSEGRLTAGMDDYLIALANERDTAIYLLKQRLS